MVELHRWAAAKDLVLDFLLDVWFCRIWGLPKVVCRLQNIVVGWEKAQHLCAFMQSDWSKWSFTLIWPEQSSAIWKYGGFTQCIKAEHAYLLLGAMKMFSPLHFTASAYLIQWMWVCSLHCCWGFIHSLYGIIKSFWKAIECINHCYRWVDSFLCYFPCSIMWSNVLSGLFQQSYSRACAWLTWVIPKINMWAIPWHTGSVYSPIAPNTQKLLIECNLNNCSL